VSLAIKFPPHENGNFWPEPGVSVPEGFFWDGATLWYRQETGVLRAAPGNFRWSASGTLLFFLGRQGYEMPDRVLERTQVMVTLQDREQDLRKASLFLMGIFSGFSNHFATFGGMAFGPEHSACPGDDSKSSFVES